MELSESLTQSYKTNANTLHHQHVDVEMSSPQSPIDVEMPPPPIDFEMPPPIPKHLRNRKCECVYGYSFTDAFMQARFDTHPPALAEPEPPRSSWRWHQYKLNAIFDDAERVGLGYSVHFEELLVDHVDIAYWSYTDGGCIRKSVPTARHLKKFADALGIMEPAGWFDTKFPYVSRCGCCAHGNDT
ncbi:hypothetical protein DFH06DRAFT_1171557 [Mycena polygramma]|nr:hypothetical protein DFH06DRAFT_1171557 [Mycena polygramma]